MAPKKKEEVAEDNAPEIEEKKVEELSEAPEEIGSTDDKKETKEETTKAKRSPKKTKKDEVEDREPGEGKAEETPKKKSTRKAKKEEAKEEAPQGDETEEAPKKTTSKKTKKKDAEKEPEDTGPGEAAEEKEDIPVQVSETEDVVEDVKEPAEGSPDDAPPDEETKEKPRKRSTKKTKEEGPFPEDLVFGRYNSKEVVVEDPSLKAFINLDPSYVPHSSARHANKPFHKHKISIVERLINNMMRTEKYTGKKTKSYKAVLEAFQIIEKRTKENPVQVLVRAEVREHSVGDIRKGHTTSSLDAIDCRALQG
ncbi:MAG: hypothetical protein ACMUHY_07085, partial [Thermoplasmatota archaeon]